MYDMMTGATRGMGRGLPCRPDHSQMPKFTSGASLVPRLTCLPSSLGHKAWMPLKLRKSSIGIPPCMLKASSSAFSDSKTLGLQICLCLRMLECLRSGCVALRCQVVIAGKVPRVLASACSGRLQNVARKKPQSFSAHARSGVHG